MNIMRRIIIFKSKNIDKLVFIPTVILFFGVSIFLMIGGSSLQGVLNIVLSWITGNMGWGYMWIYIINFLFFGYLIFSKYGNIRLGDVDEKPAYSNFQWGSMVFATAIDASILMLSMVDPLRYVQSPEGGVKPFSESAYNLAHMYGQYDWGPMAWLMFGAPTIAIGYMMYNKKRKIQSLSDAITILDGDSLWKNITKKIVNILVVFGIMGGVGASVGLEIPIISNVLSSLTGLPDNLMMKIGLFLVLFVIFSAAVFKGLNGGIDKLSNAHIWTAIIFLAIVLILGPTVYILKSETNSVGVLIQKFIPMSLNTVPNGNPSIEQQETIFYWGWWLSYMPFMGLFIAKLSRGRTIRQVLVGMLTYGALGCMSFYAILGGYSLWLQKTGTIDLVHILNTQGQAAVISAVVGSLPMKYLMFAIYFLSCFVFLATTISSSAFVLSSFTSLPLKPGQEPSRLNRMTWVVVFIIFSFSLVLVGGFETVQTFCTLAGFPLMFVCVLIIISVFKMIREDKSIIKTNSFVNRRRRKKAATVERKSAIKGKLILWPKNTINKKK
ncbi:BCCT family transporter [Apilactobacillus apisilvae]|uniref:BCCT family transporter n=1 Tax=Apilactobacillus apisilvae TaxID=2923364 RepID=A0ABY4PG19_9LACO|nr:BCCT family transporter [Apilactobacillus apisilvae]UQS84456.1 BCCT family transporter [Apilactobacillus apisilvae]